MRHAKYLVHSPCLVDGRFHFHLAKMGQLCACSVQGRYELRVTSVAVFSTIQREMFQLGDPKGVGSEDYPLPWPSTQGHPQTQMLISSKGGNDHKQTMQRKAVP